MARIIIRPTSKGQVTLPKSIRAKLNVDSDTYLDVSVKGKKIILEPVGLTPRTDDSELAEWLETDKISRTNADWLNKVLKTNRF